jgi:hypothetical protein
MEKVVEKFEKRYLCISRTPETIYIGGSTLGNQVTVYPGGAIIITTPEEEKYINLTRKFKLQESIEKTETTQVLEKIGTSSKKTFKS